ncbi:MAG: PKD domain-containing protein [Chitinophagales bacterium]|nr:PKD domain-containing protein [Chitinophagales bacterium]
MKKLSVFLILIVVKIALAQAQLNANFTISKDKGCAPLAVQFSNTTTGNPDSCFWQLGITGNTSSICNPGAIYPTPGIYFVTLTVFKGGQTSSVTKQIRVFKNPIANFSGLPRNGCVPTNVQFTDLSTQGDTTINNWFWATGDGNTEIIKNPLHPYTFGGNFGVALIVKDINGCTNTATKNNYINIFDTSTISFTISQNIFCGVPATVNFNASSNAPNGSTYMWYFGDGDSSATKNTSHTYTQYGNYTVSVSVTNPNGCTTTARKDTVIRIQPFAIDFALPTACLNKPVRFKALSNLLPVTVKWDFGNGVFSTSSDTSIRYADTGFYTVKLIARSQNNCFDTIIKTVHVTQTKADFTVDKQKSCSPFTANFTNLSSNADSSKWLIIYKTGSRFDTIVSTSQNPAVFLPAVSAFNGGTGGVYYDVILITTNTGGCKDTLIKRKYIYIVQDDVKFLVDKFEGCQPLTVKFTYQVLSRNFPYSQIIIHYDDGTQEILDTSKTTQTHVYANVGTYQPYLEIIYPDSLCNQILFLPPPSKIKVGPRVDFFGSINDNEVCVGDCILGTATGGLPTTVFTWTPSGSGVNANICFNVRPTEPGTMQVKLQAYTNGCRQDTIIDTVRVRYPLAITDEVPRYCNDDFSPNVYFVNRSLGADSSVWDFGDGTILISNADTVRHTYTDDLPKTVILTVFNFASGCSNFKKIILPGFYRPNFSLTNTAKRCVPFLLKVTAAQAPYATSYRIQIENIDPTKNFKIDTVRSSIDTMIRIPGTYRIKLIVKYGDNCQTSIDSLITIAELKANFLINRLNTCTNVQLLDSNIVSFSPLQSMVWKYTNGAIISTTSNPTINLRFDTSTIRYTIVNTFGCRDSVEKKIISLKPTANFTASKTKVCPNLPITFVNTSTPISSNVSYTWYFGDGDSSNTTSPIHAYTQTGTYTVKLILRDSLNCTDTLIKINYIKILNTTPDFTATPRNKTCPNLITNFTMLPAAETKYTSVVWDFGNGNVSNENNQNPRVVYTYPDSFDVKLITKDTFGCIDTVMKKDYIIVGGPSATYSFQPTDGCIPLDVAFTASFNKTASAIWDFGNGDLLFDDSLKNNLTHLYTTEGTYTPALILRDTAGCTVTFKATKAINPSLIKTKIIPNKLYNCNLENALFKDSSYITYNANISNIQWKVENGIFNNYTPDSTFIFTPTTPKPFYTIYLTAFSSAGCVAKDSITVIEYNTPIIKATDKIICPGDSVELNESGAAYYSWSPASTLSNASIPNPIAHPLVTTQYTVIAYDTAICPIYDTISVVVKNTLSGGALKDDTICVGDSVQLRAFSETSATQSTLYSWLPNTTISNPNDSVPFVFPTTSTTYTVTINNGGSCAQQSYPVNITVFPNPTVTAFANLTVVPGTAVNLTAISPNQVSYNWIPNTNVACDTCPKTTAIINNNITYTVLVTDSNQCKATATIQFKVATICDSSLIYIPNAFTPNNDGQNDIFYVRSNILTSSYLMIYDRWGHKVFESTDINLGWDGNYKGQPAQVEAYGYYFEGTCFENSKIIRKGNITLLR